MSLSEVSEPRLRDESKSRTSFHARIRSNTPQHGGKRREILPSDQLKELNHEEALFRKEVRLGVNQRDQRVPGIEEYPKKRTEEFSESSKGFRKISSRFAEKLGRVFTRLSRFPRRGAGTDKAGYGIPERHGIQGGNRKSVETSCPLFQRSESNDENSCSLTHLSETDTNPKKVRSKSRTNFSASYDDNSPLAEIRNRLNHRGEKLKTLTEDSKKMREGANVFLEEVIAFRNRNSKKAQFDGFSSQRRCLP